MHVGILFTMTKAVRTVWELFISELQKLRNARVNMDLYLASEDCHMTFTKEIWDFV
jgi:hypothetical protein